MATKIRIIVPFLLACAPELLRGAPAPPPGPPTLVLEVSGIVLIVDKTNALRLILPDIRKAHQHNAFIQFPQSNLVDATSFPCDTWIDGHLYCTKRLADSHEIALDPNVLASRVLSNISGQILDAIPLAELSPGATLKPGYDSSKPDRNLVAAWLDLSQGTLAVSPYREPVFWKFKDKNGHVVAERCIAESVLVTELLKTDHITFEGLSLQTNADNEIRITIGNMLPNDEAGVHIPRPPKDLHFRHYYEFFDNVASPLTPEITKRSCPPSPQADSRVVIFRFHGSNCPPVRIKE